ncbi:hypothetical protein, partial [Arthrobacter sp. Soil736]|uniref:hypothetical protein n=1 Tax=Arthrobacter sp. Soil736 TaxID=1736395 RepID=UPI001F11D52B
MNNSLNTSPETAQTPIEDPIALLGVLVRIDSVNPATRLTNSARETGCMPHLRNAREITGRYGHGGD